MGFMLPWPTHDRYFDYERGIQESELWVAADTC